MGGRCFFIACNWLQSAARVGPAHGHTLVNAPPLEFFFSVQEGGSTCPILFKAGARTKKRDRVGSIW